MPSEHYHLSYFRSKINEFRQPRVPIVHTPNLITFNALKLRTFLQSKQQVLRIELAGVGNAIFSCIAIEGILSVAKDLKKMLPSASRPRLQTRKHTWRSHWFITFCNLDFERCLDTQPWLKFVNLLHSLISRKLALSRIQAACTLHKRAMCELCVFFPHPLWPRIPWNKGISLPQLHLAVRSCEDAIISPEVIKNGPNTTYINIHNIWNPFPNLIDSTFKSCHSDMVSTSHQKQLSRLKDVKECAYLPPII